MRRIARDPADHHQITGSDADESMQGSETTRGETTRGLVVVAAAVLAFGAGLSWLDMDRRRIRQAEREWFTSHPVR
jgi:hypothetical protein